MSENREISKDMKKSAADQDLAWEEVRLGRSERRAHRAGQVDRLPKGCLPLP